MSFTWPSDLVLFRRKKKQKDWGSPSPHSRRWDEAERRDQWRSSQPTNYEKPTWGYRPADSPRSRYRGRSSYSASGRRSRFRWTYLFLLLWVAAFLAGLLLVPGTNIYALLFESFFNGFVVFFVLWGIVGIARPGIGRKAFALLLMMLIGGLAYQNPGALPGIGPNSLRNIYDGETQAMAPYEAPQSADSSNSSSIATSLFASSATSAAPPAIVRTTTVPPASATTSSTSTGPPFAAGAWLSDDPSFQGTFAKVDYPPNHDALVNFTLGLIDKDRAEAGLGPVTLSSVPSGQQHADSMAYFGYFSHWDTQGYKPYMRYTLLGGKGYVAENVGFDSCTTSPPSATFVTLASCSIQSIENGIANSEYSMINNDAACCNNGHRDNIVNPSHNQISIGIAYDSSTSRLYFVEDFIDQYINLGLPFYSSGVVTLSGDTTKAITPNEVGVSFDAPVHSWSVSASRQHVRLRPGQVVRSGLFPVRPWLYLLTYYDRWRNRGIRDKLAGDRNAAYDSILPGLLHAALWKRCVHAVFVG